MKRIPSTGILLARVLSARAEQNGRWDMAALFKVPQAAWGAAREQVQEVYSLESYQKSCNLVKSPVIFTRNEPAFSGCRGTQASCLKDPTQ